MSDGHIERKARRLFTAALLLAALVTGAWYLFSSWQYTTYQILTHDAVLGLHRDAPVTFHGVQVGKVTGVDLVDPNTVRILVEIENDAPISSATTATFISRGLSPAGFTGYVHISLQNTNHTPMRLEPEAGTGVRTIRSAPALEMSLDVEVNHANRVIQALLDHATVESLKRSVESVQQITKTLSENSEQLNSLLSNSEQASKQLAPLLQSSSDSIKALQTQVLPEAYKALSDLESLAATLKGTAERIDEDPSVLLRGRATPEPAPGETK